MSLPRYQEVLDFWFKESSSKDHWAQNDEYDQKIRDRFLEDVEKAIKNEYDDWQDEAKSSLALIILLDQFSRNLFRNDPKSYSQDTKARLLVIEGVDRQYLEDLDMPGGLFYLLPLIHRVIVRRRRHARRPHRNIIIHKAIQVRRRRQTTAIRDPRIQPALTRRVRIPGTIAVSKVADIFLR